MLETLESPIPSPTAEGSSRCDLESMTCVPESPLDPNTHAKVGELLDATPEKSSIPEVDLEVPTKAAESLVEVGEIREPCHRKTIDFSTEVVVDIPTTFLQSTFKRRESCREADPESVIISYKWAIPDHKSTIQRKQTDVPLRVVEPNPDSLVINVEGVITSGLNTNKCKHANDGNRKKKNRKSYKNHDQCDEPKSSHPRYGMGKVHVPNDDNVVHNPHNLDYEQELIVDPSGGNARNPLDGAQTIPPVPELDWNRHRLAEFPFYEGTENPTGFAFCEIWVNSSPRLLPVNPSTAGSMEQISTNAPILPQLGEFHPASNLDMFQARELLRKTRISGYLRFWCSQRQLVNLPPSGFQVVHAMYFRHFREIPLTTLMSQILLASGVLLSQFQAVFYVYIRGFSNIC